MAQTISQDDLGKDNTDQNNQQQVGIFQGNQGQGSAAPKPNANQQKGSGYTNIQRIMQANQGNRLGETIGGGIQNAGQQVQGGLNQAQQNFQQQTQQNQFDTDQNKQVVQNVFENPDQYIPTGQNNPNAQAGGQFQHLISGQYAGPTALQGADQLQAQAQNVGQQSKALGTAGGRQGLLQQYVGNPQYSAGQQRLDSLLLGQNQNAQALAQARKSAAGLNPLVNNAVLGAQAQGQEQMGKAQEFGQNLQNQFGQKIGDIDTGLQTQATAAQANRDKLYQDTLEHLKSGNVSQQEAELLGLTNGQEITENMLGNMQNFLTEGPTKASAQNMASQQDYARMNALRQLAGQYAPTSAQDVLGKYQGQDQEAGKFAAEQALKADKDKFTENLGSQVKDWHGTVDPANDWLHSAQNIDRLFHGQVNDKERSDYMAAHPELAAGYNPMGGNPMGGSLDPNGQPRSVDGSTIGQDLISRVYGPAAGFGSGWDIRAVGKYYTDAINNQRDALERMKQAYGGIKTVNVNPNQNS